MLPYMPDYASSVTVPVVTAQPSGEYGAGGLGDIS